MNRSIAFAPGHISGFFEPVYYKQDFTRTGSRGAGICISFGAVSEVFIEESETQVFEFFLNNKKSRSPVTRLALKYLLGNMPVHIVVKTSMDLPLGQGFGMSAACALSSSIAVAKMFGLSQSDALKSSHFAEVQLRTGLGDVMASSFGGVEIRKEPGLPPWGVIEHIPGEFDVVLCVIGKKLETKKILSDTNLSVNISNYGKFCTKKLLENPCVENFFSLSKVFMQKTNLADEKVIQAINSCENIGIGSMCMLGNSVFAIGKTDELCKILSSFGKVFVCSVDKNGARTLENINNVYK